MSLKMMPGFGKSGMSLILLKMISFSSADKMLIIFSPITIYLNCASVSLFIDLEKTKQKIVVPLESLRFQGRSARQVDLLNCYPKSDP